MKYEELRPIIRTGDLLGVHGTSFISRIIEFFKGGGGDKQAWSHVGVFYWQGDGLWIAQEYEGVGFGCYPASTLISRFIGERSVCYYAKAPALVEGNGAGVVNTIATYRITPRLRPYGYGSLFRILLDERTDPDDVQAVCSTFAQQAWEACGYKFNSLLAPEDFKPLVENITVIE